MRPKFLITLELRVERTDTEFGELLGFLDGHPLTMQVVLNQLGHRTATELHLALKERSYQFRR